MMTRIVLALVIAIALSACAQAPTCDWQAWNPYGDGIGNNFHRWRGLDEPYGKPCQPPSSQVGQQEVPKSTQ